MKHQPKVLSLAGFIAAALAPLALAQDVPDWQAKAGGQMAFEVASVKLSNKVFVRPSFPLDVGESFHPTGGTFRAGGFPLLTFIQFAYKIAPADEQRREMLAHLPKWVTDEGYTIEARAAGEPTKDQYRLMMQSVLAERFHLSVHFETRELSVFALALVKSGNLGPELHAHADNAACGPRATPDAPTPARIIRGNDPRDNGLFPPVCDVVALIRKQTGTMLLGYRNATAELMVGALTSIAGQGRPLIDRTGLTGRFDFTLEWAPEPTGPPPADGSATPPPGATPQEALRDQLGLRLESTKAPVRTLIVDRVERPTGN